jgi:type II secretory pathway component PulC
MKSPLWIVNSIFALLLLFLFVLMFLLKKPIIIRTSIIPREITAPVTHDISQINPVRIYESDLFKTMSVKTEPVLPEETEQPVAPPIPPQPKSFVKKPRTMPEFLPPLDVELKGIIYNSNSIYSRAIIMNRKTKVENLYKIGDSIEDAHLIFIGKNKAMFVRSNGQQETLFVSAEAAQKDPLYAPAPVSNAVERIDEYNYLVNTKQFIKEIQNLAQFLDALDITTAFDRGQVVGCRVGKLLPKSIGSALGLHYGDVITNIDGIPATTTTNRVKIFKHITSIENNQQISVAILRGNNPINLSYILQSETPKKAIPEAVKILPAGTPLPTEMHHAMRNNKKATEVTEHLVNQAQSNNNVADMFRKNDQKAMLDYGGRNTLLQR